MTAILDRAPASTDHATMYLDLLRDALLRAHDREAYAMLPLPTALAPRPLRRLAARLPLRLLRRVDTRERDLGRTWPPNAETMIGRARLDNLRDCIASILADEIPGDLLEAGVWRGGASIFMRGALAAYGDECRAVWCADSFRGLPKPDAARHRADAGDIHWAFGQLAVPVEEVRANFAAYGLLDERVRFLVGWFRDTLPAAPVDRLALLRVDGDMYESTMDALAALYDRLSPGGYCIVDDYGGLARCRAAVDDFRRERGIAEPIRRIDWTGVYWRKATG